MVLILTLLFPSGVFAYSYGDPSKEDLAETFKLILVRLNNANPDWTGAYEAYKVRRPEISSHFGESVAVTLDINFEDKNKELLIDNYKALLVMNIKRRFDYAEKDINDYSKTKILLAKAKGTYDTIQPYVQEKVPNEIQNLQTAFEKALEALGNPGLFGVGEKPVQPEEFKKQSTFILKTITPLFPYKEAKRKSEPSQSTNTTNTNNSNNTAATNTTNTTDKDNSTSTKNSSSSNSTEQTTKQTTNSDEKAVSTVASTSDSKEKDSEEEVQSKSNTEEGSTNDSEEQSTTDSESKDEQSTEAPNVEDSETEAQKEVASEEIETTQKLAHDPMERTKKTNVGTSIIVIMLVALLGIGSIVFLRKKGFI
jgi:hypothetical protein